MALFLSSVERSVKKGTAVIKLNANITEEGMKANNQSMSPNPPWPTATTIVSGHLS